MIAILKSKTSMLLHDYSNDFRFDVGMLWSYGSIEAWQLRHFVVYSFSVILKAANKLRPKGR